MNAYESGKRAYEDGRGKKDWPKAFKIDRSKQMDFEAGWEESHQADIMHPDFMETFEGIFCD